MCTMDSMFRTKLFAKLNLDSTQMSRGLWILLILLILFGSALRLFQWDERSLWQDEVFTVSLATGNPLFESTLLPDNFEPDPSTPQAPEYYRKKANALQSWDDFVAGLQHNIQMPFYPFVIRHWVTFLTDSPIHLRMLSILAGVLAIPSAFFLGRELMDNRLGLLMAGIFTLSGFQLIYSQTARVYALLTLITLLSSWVLIRLTRLPQRKKSLLCLLFAVLSLLGAYSHYFYGFILIFHGAWAVLQSVKSSELRKPLLITGLMIGFFSLPGLWLLFNQLQFIKTIGHGNLNGLWEPLNLMERLWSNLLSMISPKDTPTKIVVFMLIIGGVVQGLRKKLPAPPLLFAGLWLLILVGGLVSVDLISETHRIMSKRYLILASPAIVLLLAYGLYALFTSFPKQRVIVGLLFCGFVGLMAQNCVQVLSGEKFLRKEDYRSAGLVIQAEHQPGDLVLISHSGVHAAGMAFYLPDVITMAGISRRNEGTVWLPSKLAQHLSGLTQNKSNVWLVETHIRPRSLQQAIEAWMNQSYSLKSTRKFSSVRLLQFKKTGNARGFRRMKTRRADLK